ncbi:MAG TPA: nucleotide exchange factor GrpE [Candidatus Polarisedimenticolia bacterium]|nr:nucleotide exchange factor GrpE [Candidatus Polarisedimenticolia bacterium]
MADKNAKRGPKGPGGNGQDEDPAFSVVDRRPRFSEDEMDDAAVAEAADPAVPALLEELKARAEEAERRTREISAAYRKLDQERDALRERLSRDLERRLDTARADLMRRMLPVLDDLDRALAAARAGAGGKALLEGVALVRERLMQALQAEGVEAVEIAGKPFDPAVAEAVATEETDDPSRDQTVLEEMERGFRLRGALLRPARVKVARLRGPAGRGEVPTE